jgi:hypothetical protein
MAEKSDLVPDAPLPVRDAAYAGREPFNLRIPVDRYTDWDVEPAEFGNRTPQEVSLGIPTWMSMQVLEDADKTDPENRLRVYCLRIGKRLAYKMTFSAAVGSDSDIRRLAFMAIAQLCLEHGAEIKNSLLAESRVRKVA